MLLNQWVAEQMVTGVSAEDRRRAHGHGAGRPRRDAGQPGPGTDSALGTAPRARATSSLTRRTGELLIAAGTRLARSEAVG